MNDNQSREIFTLVSVINYMDHIKKGINVHFNRLYNMIDKNTDLMNDTNQNELINFHEKMLKQVKRLGRFFEKYDRAKVEKIIKKSEKYKAIEEKYRIDNLKQLSSNDNTELQNQFYIELMDLLKQISIYVDLIASSLLQLESIEEISE